MLTLVSIHTPTWGVTGIRVSTTSRIRSFNLHSHMGSDLCEREQRIIELVSIHTPTWGVTEMAKRDGYVIEVSIHTPTWGVTGKRR